MPDTVFSLDSGSPWRLSCEVDRVGRDYVCRIHGGAEHVGAVALSQWRDGRVVTEKLVVRGHREGAVAIHAAHSLCRAAQSNVVCVAGIHYDDLMPEQVDRVVGEAYELVRQAARALEGSMKLSCPRTG